MRSIRGTRPGLAAALLLAAAWARAAEVRTGLDVLAETRFQELQGKRVGLITNHTGRSRDGRSNVALFAQAPGVTLAAVFSPEHGFWGAVEDGQVSSGTLKLADGRVLPAYSLYGATMAPTAEMLSGLDALVFDIQDVGARFYTYATTMGMAMEAAAAARLDFYVLDRPNPINGETVEGPVLAPDIRHFTAYFSIPIRHGLTVGEIARLHKAKAGLALNLRVIKMKGWRRGLWYDETGLPWVKPSPNMPDLASATLYPGIANLEFTNLSVGRGTPHPFLWIGAPWLDADKVVARLRAAKLKGLRVSALEQTPTKSAYAGQLCRGVSFEITERARVRPLRLLAQLLCALRDLHTKEFDLNWPQTRRLVGSDRVRELYDAGAGPRRLMELFDADSRGFGKSRKPYLIY